MVVVANQRCAEEQNNISRYSNDNVEEEHRVVVFVPRMVEIGERSAESAVLQIVGYDRENGQHSHHAIVGRRQQPSENNAEEQPDELHQRVVKGSPEETLCRLLFQ